MLVKTMDPDTGRERWLPASDVFGEFSNPDQRPPTSFFDDFAELDFEDGQEPTKGARWADSFPKINGKFGVRTLKANGDYGIKRHAGHKTHMITDQGLALRASRDGDEVVAGCISAARSFSFQYGRASMRARISSIGPGQHLSWWLLPADGSWPPELDFEWIGSNQHRPDGPVDLLFLHDKSGSGLNWLTVEPGFFADWHIYTFEWHEDRMVWKVDGKVWQNSQNNVHQPMYPLVTWEVGKNKNGDFPGPVNEATPWPAEVEIDYIKVERV